MIRLCSQSFQRLMGMQHDPDHPLRLSAWCDPVPDRAGSLNPVCRLAFKAMAELIAITYLVIRHEQ
jgi:hypothetical protein